MQRKAQGLIDDQAPDYANFFMNELGYYQVEHPTANDVIIYISVIDDKHNRSVHFGFFTDDGKVISKDGATGSVYNHDKCATNYGDYYIILRKPL